MADYTSNLKTWGATGSEYPDGYSYLEGEQPVDDWDNFIRYNAIEDVEHLINLTNKRVETDSGTAHPTSPEPAHLSYRTDSERLFHYDSTASSWHGLLKVDGDTLQGTLDAGGHTVKNVGKLALSGVADLQGNDIDDTTNANTIYDSVAGNVPLAVLEQSDVTVSAGSHLSGGGTISLGGSVTVNVNDDFLLNTGDTMSGELTASRAEGSRMFTAENSTSGDRLAVQSETDGDFLLVGYDSSAGAWETGSALEYSPGTGVWTFKSNPAVNGDSIATEVWTDNNYSTTGELNSGYFQYSDNGTVDAGNISSIGVIGVADGETLEIEHASFLNEDLSAAVSGVDFVIATGTASKVTVLSGDGTTVYDDETPNTAYTNTSGGHQTVMVAIDNGHYNAGSGSKQSVHADCTARKY